MKKVKIPSRLKPGEGREYYAPYQKRASVFPCFKGQERFYAGHGWFTEGHYAIKTWKTPDIAKRPWKGSIQCELDVENVLILLRCGEGSYPITISGECLIEYCDVNMVHIVVEEGHIFYNANFIDAIFTEYPDAETRITNEGHHPLSFWVNGEVVGIVTSIKLHRHSYSEIVETKNLPEVVWAGMKNSLRDAA